ncbi:hypothetical protein H2204_009845 [Knufia peltigerae]|uniref:Major facilitator superfamily (MFS) profile domain-containing protein n=1 Tax=Knufia peltigerae TaxID=1002370 RepID=A0AA38XY69_9EURO|nr:hypothetical protein H2204_009845 [Knufia peltigerae]
MDVDNKKANSHGDLVVIPSNTHGDVQPVSADEGAAVPRLLRKLDFIVLPCLTVMYIFNSLDRSNLGNAATAGLLKDTHLKGNQYNIVLSTYYTAFVVFGPLMAVFTKICSGKVALPTMMLGFGVASAATASVRSFGALIACRMVVGAFESGFLASVVYYLSTFYTRAEIASRIALFYAGAVIASAFGGLLAYGVFHIQHAALPSWAYLFILEGCVTCLLAMAAYFVLPRDISHAWFFTAQEKRVAESRILLNSMDVQSTRFNWHGALSEFRTIHFYARALIAVCFGILAQSSANFLALMTVRLGYSVTKTNLYTVAPALTAAVFVVGFGYSSDYFCERGFHMATPMVIGLIGYIILMVVDVTNHKGTGYLAIFFCTIGAYPMSVIFSAWTVANIPDMNARALTTGTLFAIGSSTGLISSNIFVTSQAPRYMTALIINGTFSGIVQQEQRGVIMKVPWKEEEEEKEKS